MLTLTKRSLWLVLGAVSAVACGGNEGGAGPAETQARIDDTVGPVLTATARSIEFLETSELVGGADRVLGAMNASFPGLPFRLPARVLPGDDEATAAARSGHGEETPGEAFARFLREVVFTEENHEGGGVYLVGADDLCDADEPAPPAGEPSCAETVTALELRAAVTLAGDGLDVGVLIGAPRDVLVTFELRPNSVGVALDLAETGDAIRTIATVLGEDVELPTVLEGVVAATLTVNGEADVSLDLAVRAAVRVEGALPEGGAYAFATAARDPWFHGRAEGVARRLALALDVGPTRLALPWSAVSTDSLAAGVFELVLPGLTGETTLTEGDDALVVTGIGLGDATTTVKLDAATLLGIDLNPTQGRTFDLTLALTADGAPQVSVAPAFDLSLAFGLAPLAAAGDVVDSWLLDETYRVALTGAAPAVQPIEGDPGLLAILGDLTISSTAAPAPVVATTGQCLVGDAVTVGEHPVLGALAVIACP